MKLVDILNKQEIDFIETELLYHDIDKAIQDDELSDDLAEKLEDYYQLKAFDASYNLTNKGKNAESIIDKLSDVDIWQQAQEEYKELNKLVNSVETMLKARENVIVIDNSKVPILSLPNGTEYYIGYFGGDNVISEPFGVNKQVFRTFDELLDLNLHGTTLRESWMLLR